jgi:hypothetical protein
MLRRGAVLRCCLPRRRFFARCAEAPPRHALRQRYASDTAELPLPAAAAVFARC